MATVQPEGEDLRKAVKWISEEHKDRPERNYRSIIEDACLKFDLTPKAAQYLYQLLEKDRG